MPKPSDTPANFKVTHQEGYRLVGKFKDGGSGYVEDASAIRFGEKHVRRVDFFERWRDTKVISKAEFAAKECFADDYNLAHMSPRYATMDLMRVDGQAPDGVDELRAEKSKRAYGRLQNLQKNMGLRAFDAFVCCAGDGLDVQAYSKLRGFRREVVKGLLIAALGSARIFYKID